MYTVLSQKKDEPLQLLSWKLSVDDQPGSFMCSCLSSLGLFVRPHNFEAFCGSQLNKPHGWSTHHNPNSSKLAVWWSHVTLGFQNSFWYILEFHILWHSMNARQKLLRVTVMNVSKMLNFYPYKYYLLSVSIWYVIWCLFKTNIRMCIHFF